MGTNGMFAYMHGWFLWVLMYPKYLQNWRHFEDPTPAMFTLAWEGPSITFETPKPWKNAGFEPYKCGYNPPKNQGCGFPWHLDPYMDVMGDGIWA